MVSSTYVLTASAKEDGSIIALDGLVEGTGYIDGETVFLVIGNNTATGIATVTTNNGSIDSIALLDHGKDFSNNNTLSVTGEISGADNATVDVNGIGDGLIATSGVDILYEDVEITEQQVRPGGGGVLRVYFSFNAVDNINIMVRNNSDNKGILNADNSDNISPQGYYRFDIDVEAGDSINFRPTTGGSPITFILFFRAHFVRFGA